MNDQYNYSTPEADIIYGFVYLIFES